MHSDSHAPERPDVNKMVVIHRVFRREFAQIPRLVRGVRDGDTSRARLVADHLGLIVAGLHMHHTGEDAGLWPLLLDRAAPSTALVETMQEQLHRVDELVAQLAGALLEHLDLEEREILPLVSRHVSVAEWDSLGEHGKDAMSSRQLPLMFGAILEEADEGERQRMLAHLPAPIRVVMRTVAAWQYRRYITRVRAA